MIDVTKTGKNGKTYTYKQYDLVIGKKADGSPKKKSFSGKTKAEVNRKVEEFKKKFYAGTYADTKQTVGDYLTKWLEDYQHEVKPRTFQINRDLVNKKIIPRVGNIRLADLAQTNVRDLLRDVRAASAAEVAKRKKAVPKDAGVRTAQQVRQTLVNALNRAVGDEIIPRNVAEKVAAPSKPKAKMEFWTADETKAFLNSPVLKANRHYALAYLMLLSGMRKGEIFALRWSDIKGDSIRVERTLSTVDNKPVFSTPKTEKGNRSVYLEAEVFAILEAHRQRQDLERQHTKDWQDNDLIFPCSNGKPMTSSNFTKAWKRLLEKVGARYVSPHKLRHSHASLAIDNGANAVELAARLGHARPSFTQDVYAHAFAEQLQRPRVSIRDLLPERGPAN